MTFYSIYKLTGLIRTCVGYFLLFTMSAVLINKIKEFISILMPW